MYAIFVKIINGKDWRFEGFKEHEEIVNEIRETVEEENGEGSFFSVEMPKEGWDGWPE